MSGAFSKARLPVEWNGDAIREQVMEAARQSIDITRRAAEDAAGSHWWRNRSGDLAGHIIADPAKRTGPTTVPGKIGSTEGRGGYYGLFLEHRTPFLRLPLIDTSAT